MPNSYKILAMLKSLDKSTIYAHKVFAPTSCHKIYYLAQQVHLDCRSFKTATGQRHNSLILLCIICASLYHNSFRDICVSCYIGGLLRVSLQPQTICIGLLTRISHEKHQNSFFTLLKNRLCLLIIFKYNLNVLISISFIFIFDVFHEKCGLGDIFNSTSCIREPERKTVILEH